MRALAVCAVAEEAAALVRDLPGAVEQETGPLAGWLWHGDDVELVVVVAGVGPGASAAATGIALAWDITKWDAVLNLGIAGGFVGTGAEMGTVVVADELVAADLGVIAPEGFLDVEVLGFGTALARYTPPAELVAEAVKRCSAAGLTTRAGRILTLSTFTGTDARAAELVARLSPTAEAMEGTGCANAAAHFGVPVLEVRTISNPVGDRDREGWDLVGALDALARAGAALFGASWEL